MGTANRLVKVNYYCGKLHLQIHSIEVFLYSVVLKQSILYLYKMNWFFK